jgi:hypothetical protein
MQNAKCKMEKEAGARRTASLFPFCILHFAFCIEPLTFGHGAPIRR